MSALKYNTATPNSYFARSSNFLSRKWAMRITAARWFASIIYPGMNVWDTNWLSRWFRNRFKNPALAVTRPPEPLLVEMRTTSLYLVTANFFFMLNVLFSSLLGIISGTSPLSIVIRLVQVIRLYGFFKTGSERLWLDLPSSTSDRATGWTWMRLILVWIEETHPFILSLKLSVT